MVLTSVVLGFGWVCYDYIIIIIIELRLYKELGITWNLADNRRRVENL